MNGHAEQTNKGNVTRACARVFVCVCVWICVCVYPYVCVCVISGLETGLICILLIKRVWLWSTGTVYWGNERGDD